MYVYTYIYIHGEDEAQDRQSVATMRPKKAKARPKMAKTRPEMAKMRLKMAKMRLTMPKMRAPHPHIPSASSAYPIDWRAKWGPRWIQVGSKSSQDCS